MPTVTGGVVFSSSLASPALNNNTSLYSGADPAIGGLGGRLPLWAALSEKTGFYIAILHLVKTH